MDINSKIINNQIVSDTSKIQAVESLGIDVTDIPLKSIESNGKKIDFKTHKGSAYFSSDKIDKLVINQNEEKVFSFAVDNSISNKIINLEWEGSTVNLSL